MTRVLVAKYRATGDRPPPAIRDRAARSREQPASSSTSWRTWSRHGQGAGAHPREV